MADPYADVEVRGEEEDPYADLAAPQGPMEFDDSGAAMGRRVATDGPGVIELDPMEIQGSPASDHERILQHLGMSPSTARSVMDTAVNVAGLGSRDAGRRMVGALTHLGPVGEEELALPGLSGATLGFIDELAGAGAALTGGDYRDTRDAVRARLDVQRAMSPGDSAAAEAVGNLATSALAMPAGAARTVGGRLAQSIGTNAALSGLHDAGQAEELADVPGAYVGGAVRGGLTGGLVQGLGETFSAGVNAAGRILSGPSGEKVANAVTRTVGGGIGAAVGASTGGGWGAMIGRDTGAELAAPMAQSVHQWLSRTLQFSPQVFGRYTQSLANAAARGADAVAAYLHVQQQRDPEFRRTWQAAQSGSNND